MNDSQNPVSPQLNPPPKKRSVLGRSSYGESLRIAEILRLETVGGALLLIATVIAVVWSNSPFADSYFSIRDFKLGGYVPFFGSELKLELSIGAWASDLLLALFFFLAGLELKREFVAGDLRKPSRAIVPVAAAFGGVMVPALIFFLTNLGTSDNTVRGWAIPTATDIAFALAVLAVIGSHLPSALRTFLLTLAIVDDLIAITIIALFYTTDLKPQYLLLAVLPIFLFGLLVQKRIVKWYLLVPLALIAWVFIHESGVHATVAGVLLAFTVPVLRSEANGGPEAGPGLAEMLEHRLRPLSAGFAVPVFAFFSAGVALGGWEGFQSALGDRVTIGIVLGLVLGKLIGVFGATWLVTKTTRANLDEDLAWVDVLGLSLLAGIGFTVSLLVSDLSYGSGSPHDDHAKVAILVGSLLAALLATIVLRTRNRHYRLVEESEKVDANQDGIPDKFEQNDD
ncbi:Na+/H+ antiporter NhaA [Haematomicrobium sanguinis]|uniref:Na+/H+ antiporter NhaA n=1 Tax=Haematomicrobium sanguinis TaxID=479106 RepID=UPI00068EF98C|nr:Na+/H+ antiporter NhaA [Haematomicrobium sanguinis]